MFSSRFVGYPRPWSKKRSYDVGKKINDIEKA